MADADVARAHEHFVGRDRGYVDVATPRRDAVPRRPAPSSDVPPHWSTSTLISSAVPDAKRAKASGAPSRSTLARHDALDRQIAGCDLRGDAIEVVHPVAPGPDDREIVERPEHRLDGCLADEQARSARACRAGGASRSRPRSRSGARSTRSPRRRRGRRSRPGGTRGRRRVVGSSTVATPSASARARRAGFGSEM